MDRFMKRALELAVNNVGDGGQPFGAVLVKNGEAVSEGVNELHNNYDVSGHAELLAIRHAQKKLETNDLSGHTMYASGEPCPMCLAAIYLAGIEEVFYCSTAEDAAAAGLGGARVIYQELQKPQAERKLPMTHLPLSEGQEDPLKLWGERG